MPGVKTNEHEGTRAVLRHSRVSASKVRQVLDLIRGQDVDRAAETLSLGNREAAFTVGKVLAQLVRSENAPEKGTGWHYHGADFHIVYMLKGWARFMYEDKETLVEAGDCVHQRPGIVHYLFDYSPDMEYLEVVAPADFTTIETVGPCPVPDPTPWK